MKVTVNKLIKTILTPSLSYVYTHSFCCLHSIDTNSFLTDLKSSQLIVNPPDSRLSVNSIL